jgi:predicted nuclease of predicted toxin-antitoxin system
MKVLLDENLPHQLRGELPGHEVITVKYMGWHGIRNGELLALNHLKPQTIVLVS